MITSKYNSDLQPFQPQEATKQTPTHNQSNRISEKNSSSTKDRRQNLEYLSNPKKKQNSLTQNSGQGAYNRISATGSTGLPTTQSNSGKIIPEKEPSSRNHQTVPESVNDGLNIPEFKQQDRNPPTIYPTDGGSSSNHHPQLEPSGDIAPNPNPNVDALSCKQAHKLLRTVHRDSKEFLESIVGHLHLFLLRVYAIAVYDLDRHGNYQKEKSKEEKKTSRNSKKTKASKDSQLNYGYMSGAVGTLNLFFTPSNKSGEAEERIRKILEDRPANRTGCVHKEGCLTAFVDEKLDKLQLCKPQKKKRQQEKRQQKKSQQKKSQQDPTEIQYKRLLERLKGAIQSGDLALPAGEKARPFFQVMHEYGKCLKVYMLKSSKYTKKAWWPMLAKRFSLHLDNQDQHPIQDQQQTQDQSPIQDQLPLQGEPRNEQPLQQDQQLPQGSPMPEGQEFYAGSLNSGQRQFEFWDGVCINEDYYHFSRTTQLDDLNYGRPFDSSYPGFSFGFYDERNSDGSSPRLSQD